MATTTSSRVRSNAKDESAKCLTKWPLEYVVETMEFLCGWCGQAVIPNRTTEDLKTHFKSCRNSSNNGLLMVFKELQKVNQHFQVLAADVSEIKKTVDTIQTEIAKEKKAANKSHMKSKFNNKFLCSKTKSGKARDANLSALFSKVKFLEEEMLRDMGVSQKMKVNGRVREAISTADHFMLEGVTGNDVTSSVDSSARTQLQISEQVKNNDGNFGVIKRRVENDAGTEKESTIKKMKSFHAANPSPLDPPTICIIMMNCYNLVTQHHLFQPSFKWSINKISSITTRKIFTLASQTFRWNGYPVQARAKLQLKEDDYVYTSLSLKGVERCSKDFTLIPRVYYLLKDKTSSASEARHLCESQCYLSGSAFSYSLEFEQSFVHKDWLNLPTYNVDDAVEIEIYVEPFATTQQVHSNEGTLEWKIENYARRLRLEKEWLVLYQESPYFYTGSSGYRVNVEMYLNGVGGSGPTARIAFWAGKFDAQLPKSFPHSTTVTLINRKVPERSVSKTVVEDIRNKREYTIELCEVGEVENLLENDALFCKVVIKAH